MHTYSNKIIFKRKPLLKSVFKISKITIVDLYYLLCEQRGSPSSTGFLIFHLTLVKQRYSWIIGVEPSTKLHLCLGDSGGQKFGGLLPAKRFLCTKTTRSVCACRTFSASVSLSTQEHKLLQILI